MLFIKMLVGALLLGSNLLAGPLHDAARTGDVAKVQALLDQGCDPDDRLPFMRSTPLHLAAYYGHTEVVGCLLIKGAQEGARDRQQETPLHCAALSLNLPGAVAVVDLLLKFGVDRFALDCMERSPKDIALDRGFYSFVTTCGYELTEEEKNRECLPMDTPLHEAVRKGDLARVQELIKTNPELIHAVTGGTRNTPLHLAAWYGRKEIAEVLLDAGANINAQAALEYTPLHCAVQANSSPLVAVCIASKADGTIGDALGDRPLHYAAATASTEIVRSLVYDNPDTRKLKNLADQTPWDVAQSFGRDLIILHL